MRGIIFLLKIYKILLLLIVNIFFLLLGASVKLFFYKNPAVGTRIMAFCSMLWARALCRIFGIRLFIRGHFKEMRHCFIVSNHVSYLDILALASVRPSVFISKQEVKDWPLLGWLAQLGGAIFVDRNSKRSSLKALHEVEKVISCKVSIAIFPEGTTSDGSEIKEFKSSFFDVPARLKIPVQPVSIKYLSSNGNNPIAWYGDMYLLPHLWKILGMRYIDVSLYFNPVIKDVKTGFSRAQPRKTLSSISHKSIKDGLSMPFHNLTGN